MFKQIGLANKVKEKDIDIYWEEIVGETINKHSKPVKIEYGRLLVNVDSSAWLNELERYSKGMILGKIKEKFGNSMIKSIRFQLGEIK